MGCLYLWVLDNLGVERGILLEELGLGCRDEGSNIFPQAHSFPSQSGILGGCPLTRRQGWNGQRTPVLRLTPVEEEARLQRQTLRE